MSDCPDRPTFFPEAIWKALMNLPALRYMKAPVNTESELYEKYPIGNEKGTFAFVHDENTFYTYHPRGWNRGKWKPIAGGIESFFEIDAEFLKEGDILIYDNSKKKFVVKSGNIWNKIIDKASSYIQIAKFFNEVEEIPTDESDSGIYFVHKDEEKEDGIIEFRAYYLVLGGKAIKIFNSSDYRTKEEVDTEFAKKANQRQVDDIAASVDVLSVTKAEKSVVDALMNGIIKQPGVDTYSQLLSTYPNPEIGWDVLVRSENTRYNWNGTAWVDMEVGDYSDDLLLSAYSVGNTTTINVDTVNRKVILSGAIILCGNIKYTQPGEPIVELDFSTINGTAFILFDISTHEFSILEISMIVGKFPDNKAFLGFVRFVNSNYRINGSYSIDGKSYVPRVDMIYENQVLGFMGDREDRLMNQKAITKNIEKYKGKECFLTHVFPNTNGYKITTDNTTGKITFDVNPSFVLNDGRKFKIFEDEAEEFSLTIPGNSFAYVDVSDLGSDISWSERPLLEVKYMNFVTSRVIIPNACIILGIRWSTEISNLGVIGDYLRKQSMIKLVDANKNKECYLTDIYPNSGGYNITTDNVNGKITFDINPSFALNDGRKFKIFADDAEEFTLTIPENSILYVDVENLADNTSWSGKPLLATNTRNIVLTQGRLSNAPIILAARWGKKIADIGVIGDYIKYKRLEKNISENIKPKTVRDYFPILNYYRESDKIKKFREITLKKNKDAIVCFTGTSLLKGYSRASVRFDANERPPLLHAVDFGGLLYDKLVRNWVGQKSRRYDHEFFTLIGDNWTTTDTDANWDDAPPAHNGFTKYSTEANSGVSFIVPSDAYRFNFIYRTDALGDICSIVIAAGNGLMEVLDESDNVWKEVNGFQFSMQESPATETKGNTVYQKRLNMRCKNRYDVGGINSIGTEKHMTITKGNNTDKRFLLVGAEWSPREFMLMVINGARGSHNWGTGDLDNSKFQDSDIWVHKPNLLIAEITNVNWGASRAGVASSPNYFLNLLKTWYFNEFNNEPRSIYAKTNGYADCEVIFFNDTITTGAFNEDGSIKWGIVTVEDEYKGAQKTCYENFEIIDEYMRSEKSQYAFVALDPYFKSASEAFFGSHYLGLVGSGIEGATLTSDNTHWNDNGAALVDAVVSPLFDFV